MKPSDIATSVAAHNDFHQVIHTHHDGAIADMPENISMQLSQVESEMDVNRHVEIFQSIHEDLSDIMADIQDAN